MAKVTKNVVDKALRDEVFGDIFDNDANLCYGYTRINDRQFGALITDLNGNERYVRIGVIVAEERDDMTAKELMESEIADYTGKQAKKEEKAKAKADKIAKDEEKRKAAKADEDM